MKTFFSRLSALFFLLLCLPALWSCEDTRPVPGVVASVNGHNIFFREVEARRISQFSGRSPEAPPWTEAELRAQYRYVTNQLIEELVICQYMERKKFVLEPGLLDAEEKRIRDDYPENAFDQTLAEEGINLEDWRELLRRRLVISQFLLQVLRPEISITAEEVQQYFTEHNADFLVPEQWHFMQISALDKKTVEKARDSFVAGKNATAVQKEFLVSMHDIRMDKDRLPDDLSKGLAPLAPWKSSPVSAVGPEFRVLVLIEKTPAAMLEAAEIANRVERVLAEEKMRPLYAAWIKKRLAGADIRLAPALLTERTAAESVPGATKSATSAANASGNATVTGKEPEQNSLPGSPAVLPAAPPPAAGRENSPEQRDIN